MKKKLIAEMSTSKVVRTTVVPEVVDGGTYSDLVGAIGELLERARERIATTANTTLVETYWNTGRYIVEYEQHGSDRAKYGSELLSHLTRDLTLKHGKGYGKSNLVYMRKLYRAFPKGMTLSCQLSWRGGRRMPRQAADCGGKEKRREMRARTKTMNAAILFAASALVMVGAGRSLDDHRRCPVPACGSAADGVAVRIIDMI